MSFGINGPENIPAIQKSHHTNDGGAGNLGYFQQGKKKKEEEKEENDIVEFSSAKKNDNDEPLMDFLTIIAEKIKNWLGLQNKNG